MKHAGQKQQETLLYYHKVKGSMSVVTFGEQFLAFVGGFIGPSPDLDTRDVAALQRGSRLTL